MIKRKLQLDSKVLISAVACLAFYLLIAIEYPNWPTTGVTVQVTIAVAVISSLYGIFGTFLAAMSVGSRHSKKVKKFWEGV